MDKQCFTKKKKKIIDSFYIQKVCFGYLLLYNKPSQILLA